MARRELPQEAELARRVDSYRNALFNAGAVRVAPNRDSLFTLRNGDRSWIFVDHGLLLPNPATNKAFLDALSYAVETRFPKETTVLANVDSKSSPQTTGALAYELGYRQIAVNPETTTQVEHGTGLKLRMPDVNPGDRILVIDDVATPKDTTALNVVEQIRQALEKKHLPGLRFHLLVGLMRDPSVAEELAQQGITVHSLLTLKDLLQSEAGRLQLTEEQRIGLQEELSSVI